MRHQAGNEMDVSDEAFELANRDGAFSVTAGLDERGGELRAALDRVGVRAGTPIIRINSSAPSRWPCGCSSRA
jgi:hypothetical protein